MKLKWQVPIIVAVIAILPIAALSAWARVTTRARASSDYETRLSSTVRGVQARLEHMQNEAERETERLCRQDFVVDRALLDLAARRIDGQRLAEIGQSMPELMRSLGFDYLEIVDTTPGSDTNGRVLGSGHFPAQSGARYRGELPAAAERERATAGWRLERIRVRGDSAPSDATALILSCEAKRNGASLWLRAGTTLDPAFLDSLASGDPIIQLSFSEHAPAGNERLVHAFERHKDAPAVAIVARVDNTELHRSLQELDAAFLLAGVIAAALALIVGFTLAARISRALGVLERAADRVAQGDYSIDPSTKKRSGEIRSVLEAFERMTRDLRESRQKLARAERVAAWRDIARRMAHEIKNPLFPIQTSVETLRKAHARKHVDFDEIFDESTQTILESVERLKSTVGEFSNFARLPRPRPSVLDVADIVRHVEALFRSENVNIETRLISKRSIEGDRDQLIQVLVNLVQNGIQAARERNAHHGHIRIDLEDDPGAGGVRLQVSDNGPGVPHEVRAQIFTPYYTTKASGTGLGLAIVEKIVHDHGGKIEVDDSELGGAAFLVTLPAKFPPLPPDVSQM